MSLAPIYLSAGIRTLEALALKLPDAPRLMERAGLAAAREVQTMLGERGRRVLVAAGPGNNGGDAFELAAHLKNWFYRVDLVFMGDAEKLSADARQALRKWHEAGGRESGTLPDAPGIARNYDLIVDGLFGIGLARALEDRYAVAVETINQSGRPVAHGGARGRNRKRRAAAGRRIVRPSGWTSATQTVCVPPQWGQAGCQGAGSGGGGERRRCRARAARAWGICRWRA